MIAARTAGAFTALTAAPLAEGSALPAVVVFAYLALMLVVGIAAGAPWRPRQGDAVTGFVAGDRAFGPVVMYFVTGATIFSAYALIGTPQRVVAKGSDVLYILAFGAIGFVPTFYFGGRVRRWGARVGAVTQAELMGLRFDSPAITLVMGVATLAAFVPYVVIQLKGAGLVMEAVTGWPAAGGAALVYAVVVTYVVIGGVRGVGWTNVVQGVAMLAVVWWLGITVPTRLFGGVAAMFERVAHERPELLALPGPGPTSLGQYTSEVLVSALGFSMWPHTFMKCFTARSARLVQLTTVLYPTFLYFLVPLVFLGYAAALLGAPGDDRVLLWLLAHPDTGLGAGAFAFVAFAVLAASMSTGDALIHAGGSIAVRDVWVRGLGRPLGDRSEARAMQVCAAGLGVAAMGLLVVADRVPVVELLLLAYAVPIQFLPVVLAGLYVPRATGPGALAGLLVGLGVVVGLFVGERVGVGAWLNPWGLQIGVLGLLGNVAALVVISALTRPVPPEHLARFDP
jgi:SSS family solute:Na+ symporter